MSKKLVFEKMITKLDVLFKYSGMNIKNEIVTPLDMVKHRWLYIFNFLCVSFMGLLTIYYICICMDNGRNFIEITSIAPCLTFTALGMIKSHDHYLNEEHIKKLIVLLKNLEMKNNSREECADKKDMIDKGIEFLNTVINILCVFNILMVVIFNMTPLVMIAVKYSMTNEFQLLLPYLDVFAFMPYDIKYWPFAYVLQIWSECVILLDISATDYLFYTCCTYIRVQFKLLQYDFERIIPARSISGELQEDEFQTNFSELVKWHQDLIYSANILEIIYSKSTLFNFLTSSVVICLTGFNVTTVNDIEDTITYIIFLFLGLMQIFFLCLFADMLLSASEEVSTAVYNSPWYLARNVIGRQLLIVQTRAQEPCKLTAAGFADVNLRSFMRILSTAWSYFALLQTLYEG